MASIRGENSNMKGEKGGLECNYFMTRRPFRELLFFIHFMFSCRNFFPQWTSRISLASLKNL
jgi:hypothetical protein